MAKGTLFFTIGLPKSGKSTICDMWAKNQHIQIGYDGEYFTSTPASDDKPRTIVCSDNIRLATYGQRWWTDGEELVHAIQRIMILSLLDRGFNVIVDGTHTTIKSIRRLLEIDNNARYIYVPTDYKTCIKIANATNQKDLVPIILKMDKTLRNYVKINPPTNPQIGCFVEPSTGEIVGPKNEISIEEALYKTVEQIRKQVKSEAKHTI